MIKSPIGMSVGANAWGFEDFSGRADVYGVNTPIGGFGNVCKPNGGQQYGSVLATGRDWE